MSLLGVRCDWVDFNWLVRLYNAIAVTVRNIMSYQQPLVGIHISKTAVRDSIGSTHFMMKLTIGADFVAVVVSACG